MALIRPFPAQMGCAVPLALAIAEVGLNTAICGTKVLVGALTYFAACALSLVGLGLLIGLLALRERWRNRGEQPAKGAPTQAFVAPPLPDHASREAPYHPTRPTLIRLGLLLVAIWPVKIALGRLLVSQATCTPFTWRLYPHIPLLLMLGAAWSHWRSHWGRDASARGFSFRARTPLQIWNPAVLSFDVTVLEGEIAGEVPCTLKLARRIGWLGAGPLRGIARIHASQPRFARVDRRGAPADDPFFRLHPEAVLLVTPQYVEVCFPGKIESANALGSAAALALRSVSDLDGHGGAMAEGGYRAREPRADIDRSADLGSLAELWWASFPDAPETQP